MHRVRIAFYLAIPLLLAANWFVFRALGYDYLQWYLANGSKIAAATLLGVLSWSVLAGSYDLLSKNAADYMRACFFVAGTVLRDTGHAILGANEDSKQSGWDKLGTLIVMPLLLAVIVLWIAVVSPVNYLVTLIGGAPARFFRRIPPNPDEAMPLRDKPLELTQAINALLLLIASKLL